MMILLIGVLLTAEPAVQQDRPRLCNIGADGNIQLAYKPYGNEIFGSDGIICRPARPGRAENDRETIKPGVAGAISPGGFRIREGGPLEER